ncbi:MAG: Na/Pi cotransporter family protein [Syntrophorhabdaceae bacterium]|nr:Na/Pi cotransporter family protein [Syntrophorhabdaceae bacterium]MDD5245489.1 Na/Pi cotransporter family protein [Syntrophorhabdaceae bacterium]
MIHSIFLLLAGIALFLLGMLKLSTQMQGVFSSRIRGYIRFSVKRPFYGLITGLFTTIIFQSSSATTLLTMGLVSAGLISFYHSLGIILGADIGTTLTVQLVVWKVTDASPLFLFGGIILYFAGKGRLKVIGEALLYFGTIFYGLSLIGDASTPLKNSPFFTQYFLKAQNPFMGLLIGIVFTSIVQASAIPIGVLVILSQQGLVSIDNAIPIVIGANIGTTATALIGSIAGDLNGRRTALAHLLFKCSGALVCLVFLSPFLSILKTLSSSIAQQVALGHFLVNVIIVCLFIFILPPFSNVVCRIIPGDKKVLPLWPEFLDPKCLVRPDNALVCVKKELSREIMLAQNMLKESLDLAYEYKENRQRNIMYMELVMDNLQAEITKYLWGISCGELSQPLTKRLFAFSSFAYDIERMGDHSVNLAELAEQKYKRKAYFTEAAKEELRDIGTLVMENLSDAASLIGHKDLMLIRVVVERERRVDVKIKKAIERHLERFYKKLCVAEAGPIYVDMLVNLERISDHCRLIAELINGLDEE